MASTYRTLAKLWPNGEVTVYREIKRRIPDGFVPFPDAETQQTIRAIRAHGVEKVREFRGLPPMGLSNGPNSDRVTRKGGKGITAYGKRMTRNACYVLGQLFQQRGRRSVLSLLTLTIPSGFSEEEMSVLSDNWAYLTEGIQRYVRRRLESEGVPPHYVFVTEVQEKRSAREGRPLLHMHATFQGRKPGKGWFFEIGELGQVWQQLMRQLLENHGIRREDMPPLCASDRIERVEKSVEGYLGKYMSKGSKSASTWVEAGYADWLPRQWWGVTKAMRDRVKKAVRLINDPPLSEFLWECAAAAADDIYGWIVPIVIQGDLAEYVVSFVGRLRREVIDWLGLGVQYV